MSDGHQLRFGRDVPLVWGGPRIHLLPWHTYPASWWSTAYKATPKLPAARPRPSAPGVPVRKAGYPQTPRD